MKNLLGTILALILLSNPLLATEGDIGNGNGSSNSPFLVQDNADFEAFCIIINSAGPPVPPVYVHLECDLNLQSNSYTTAVIQQFEGFFYGNNHKITDLNISAATNNVGFFGEIINGSEIENLRLENVYISGSGSLENIGGFCGYNDGIISKCYTTGTIAVNSSISVGGFCGRNENIIMECYSKVNVQATENYGGFCGKLYEGFIDNCYATGTVTADGSDSNLGGLCGHIYFGFITNCYATGQISLSGINVGPGGLYGVGNNETITASFWDTDTSGIESMGSESGKDTEQMQSIDTFTDAGWDFDSGDGSVLWIIQPNSYPSLAWEHPLNYVGETTATFAQNETEQIQIEIFSPSSKIQDWAIEGFESCDWITNVTPTSGTLNNESSQATITFDLDSNGIDLGDHSCQLTLTNDDNDSFVFTVSINVFNKVDMEELALLSQFWQTVDCDIGHLCADADWYVDGKIDFFDLNKLAAYWLDEMVYEYAPIYDGFESGDLSALPWITDSTPLWSVTDSKAYQGSKSVTIGGSAESDSLSLTIDTTGFDTVSFYYFQQALVRMTFYIDDEVLFEPTISYNSDGWENKEFPIAEGIHTLKWEARNFTGGFWIDDLNIYKQQQFDG